MQNGLLKSYSILMLVLFEGVLSLFDKLFRKKLPEKVKMFENLTDIEFGGNIEGNGVSELRLQIGKVLRQFPQIKNAFFVKVRYRSEEIDRFALIIDAPDNSDQLGLAIAGQCQGIFEMDIYFSDSLTKNIYAEITESSEALFND